MQTRQSYHLYFLSFRFKNGIKNHNFFEVAPYDTNLLFPPSPDALALGATLKMVDALHDLDTEYRILLTIVPPKPNKAGVEARSALESAELPIFESSIRRLAVFQKAALEGVPVYAVKDSYSAIAWQCYADVAKEIINDDKKE